jgi:hypothetical protein
VSPKLRRLVPDEALFRRRAGDEPLRELARDYDVQHTTLSRYFARPEAARELKRVKRLIQAEQREAEAERRADERAERKARRRVKQQPAQASRTTEPPAAAAGEAQPAQPDARRPIRTPNSVAVPTTAERAPTREGYSGYLDRIGADRAERVGRAPGQPANSFLDPEEWLDHQATLAELDGDKERLEKIARARAEWDAR